MYHLYWTSCNTRYRTCSKLIPVTPLLVLSVIPWVEQGWEILYEKARALLEQGYLLEPPDLLEQLDHQPVQEHEDSPASSTSRTYQYLIY